MCDWVAFTGLKAKNGSAPLKILVCVKRVPETDTDPQRNAASGAARIESLSNFRMNRLDEYALEAAMRLKEARPNIVVDAITVGPQAADEVVKRAVGMGADRGMHIQTSEDEVSEADLVSARIAECIRDRAYDLILTGAMSEDRMNAQTGPMIAGLLDRAWTTNVVAVDAKDLPRRLIVEREIEGGRREELKLTMPALLTVQSSSVPPRYPTLSNLLRANRQPIETWTAGTLPGIEPRLRVFKTTVPERSRTARYLEGTAAEKAVALLDILKEKAFIR
jgi:electron transfer flavoprotein beta subunit